MQLDLVFVPQLYYPMLVRVATEVCDSLEVSLRDDSKGYDRCSLQCSRPAQPQGASRNI